MAKSDLFTFQPRSHALEHSVEVQVPFLQRVLSEFKIVPVLMGYWSEPVCSEVGRALAELVRDRNILVVASTDMSHYHNYGEANAMDAIAIESLEEMDPRAFFNKVSLKKCEACGAGAVAATMIAAKKLGADKIKILKYANSGDTVGAKNRVVGYLSAVFYKSKDGTKVPLFITYKKGLKLDGNNPRANRIWSKRVMRAVIIIYLLLGLASLGAYMKIGYEHQADYGSRYMETDK